jgi:urease beta subunit
LFFEDRAVADQVTRIAETDPQDVDSIKALAEVSERGAAHWGFRFDVASGASRRFEPTFGVEGPFSIVEIGGDRVVPGIRLDKNQADRKLDL